MQSSTVPVNCDKNNVNEVLKAGLQGILEVPRLRKLRLALIDSKMQISMDLKAIEEKMAKRCYTHVDEFVADLRRMEQNGLEDLMNEKQLLRIFKDFMNYCKLDVKLIKGCAECYWNELRDKTDGWFKESCSKPHSVVMVKVARLPYFPAKVLNFDEKKVFVRLFEELSVAEIPYGDSIRIYTKFNLPRTKQPRNAMKAIEAANLYIENIIKKFGFYNYGDIEATTTTLTAQRLAQHLQCLTSPEYKRREISEDDVMAKRVKLGSRDLHPNSDDDEIDVDVPSSEGGVKDGGLDIESESVECMSNASDLYPKSDDDNSDMDVIPTEQSVNDDRRCIDKESVEYKPPVSTNATTTTNVSSAVQASVRFQRITSSTLIAVQQSTNSPPILRDCTSRCEFPSKENEVNFLRNEMEKIKRDHQIEISTMTKSYSEIMKQMRRQHEAEQAEIVQETKTKQWCANCWNEAKLYCCWQTSYCDDFCQRKHWLQHRVKCLNEQSLEREEQ